VGRCPTHLSRVYPATSDMGLHPAGLRWHFAAVRANLAKARENELQTPKSGTCRELWRVLGSNQRRLSRRFYRPLPLTTRATRQGAAIGTRNSSRHYRVPSGDVHRYRRWDYGQGRSDLRHGGT
jgi:hypothetical protein